MIPPKASDLVAQREQARADRDWSTSDRLRDELRALGWVVRDTPDGQVLTEAPDYEVHRSVRDLPTVQTGTTTVGLLVEGWPDDLRTCVTALLEHSDATVVLLENGETDAGATVHELAGHARVVELHVEQAAGWAEAHNALIACCASEVHVLMDVSTVLEGPALAMLIDHLATFDAAGWKGVAVDDDWLAFRDAPPGEVEALLGYLVAVRTTVARDVPLPPKARFYRNADLEWSFLLREQGRRLVAVDVPVRQDRHRGYHDSEPAYRDKESRKTYDRFLQRFRGRDDLRIT